MADAFATIADGCASVLKHIDAVWSGLPLDESDAAEWLRVTLGRPPDLVVRTIGDVSILYLATIVDHLRIEDAITRPLTMAAGGRWPSPTTFADESSRLRTYGDATDALLAANVVLLLRGRPGGFAMNMDKWPLREIEEPPAEFLAQGPHMGFIEDLDTNIALVRHGAPDPRLRWEHIAAGQPSTTRGAMLYMDGMVRMDVLARVRRHLRRARPSFTVESNMLGQWLAPRLNALFPTVGATERPDRVVAAILEGRVAVLVAGSPTALLMPNVFAHMLHVPEDYYQTPIPVLANRLVRVVGLAVASGASPMLVALTTINHDLIPQRLFIAVAQARRGVPIPIAIEVLILELLIEVIREAGVRMPGPVGQSVAVLGAVIVGQAAVMAGLISAPAVVVVSLAFIASFVLPSSDLVMTLRLMRYPLIVLAAVFGLYGLTWGLLIVLIYVCALDSFGVPYLAPLTPLRVRGLQDTLWRRPLPNLRRSFLAARARGGAR
jgi:hypothetical protein